MNRALFTLLFVLIVAPTVIATTGTDATYFQVNDNATRAQIFHALASAHLDTLFIDAKLEDGTLGFAAKSALAEQIGANLSWPFLQDPLEKAIADTNGTRIGVRLSLGQDAKYAAAFPNETIQAPWVDLGCPNYQNYLLELVRQLAFRGVNEINLDFIRYPDTADVANPILPCTKNQSKAAILNALAQNITDTAKEINRAVTISADVFGRVCEHNEEGDPIIGQSTTLSQHVDVIMPLLYPEENDAQDRPYEWVKDFTTCFTKVIPPRQVTPWIQGFGSLANAPAILAQINATKDANANGYFIWWLGELLPNSPVWEELGSAPQTPEEQPGELGEKIVTLKRIPLNGTLGISLILSDAVLNLNRAESYAATNAFFSFDDNTTSGFVDFVMGFYNVGLGEQTFSTAPIVSVNPIHTIVAADNITFVNATLHANTQAASWETSRAAIYTTLTFPLYQKDVNVGNASFQIALRTLTQNGTIQVPLFDYPGHQIAILQIDNFAHVELEPIKYISNTFAGHIFTQNGQPLTTSVIQAFSIDGGREAVIFNGTYGMQAPFTLWGTNASIISFYIDGIFIQNIALDQETPFRTINFTVPFNNSENNFPDSDLDGVPNSHDLCPGSTSRFVNSKGCTCEQLLASTCINQACTIKERVPTCAPKPKPITPACQPKTCLDNKPDYCSQNQTQIKNCGICSCPQDFTCGPDGDCFKTLQLTGLKCAINDYRYGQNLNCKTLNDELQKLIEAYNNKTRNARNQTLLHTNTSIATKTSTLDQNELNQSNTLEQFETLNVASIAPENNTYYDQGDLRRFFHVKASGLGPFDSDLEEQIKNVIKSYHVCIAASDLGCVLPDVKCTGEDQWNQYVGTVQNMIQQQIDRQLKGALPSQDTIVGTTTGTGVAAGAAYGGVVGGVVGGALGLSLGLFSGLDVKITVDLRSLNSSSIRIPYHCNPINITSELACKEIIHNGPSETKADIVFVGDGFFTDAELEQKARQLIDYDGVRVNTTSEGLFSIEPFKSNKKRFNIWILTAKDRIGHAVTTGSLSEGAKPKTADVQKLAAGCPQRDYIVVVSKNAYRSECGFGTLIDPCKVSLSSEPYPGRLLLHEFGHGFGLLGDEYYNYIKELDSPNALSGMNALFQGQTPNCKTLEEAKKAWGDLVTANSTYGYYPGCGADCGIQCATLVRPTPNSIMRAQVCAKNSTSTIQTTSTGKSFTFCSAKGPPFDPYYQVNDRELEKHLANYTLS